MQRNYLVKKGAPIVNISAGDADKCEENISNSVWVFIFMRLVLLSQFCRIIAVCSIVKVLRRSIHPKLPVNSWKYGLCVNLLLLCDCLVVLVSRVDTTLPISLITENLFFTQKALHRIASITKENTKANKQIKSYISSRIGSFEINTKEQYIIHFQWTNRCHYIVNKWNLCFFFFLKDSLFKMGFASSKAGFASRNAIIDRINIRNRLEFIRLYEPL